MARWRDINPEKLERINAWGSVNLNQTDAREFRTHIVDHLNAAFDFTDFLKRVGGKIDLKVDDIKLPHAQAIDQMRLLMLEMMRAQDYVWCIWHLSDLH